MRPRSSDRVSVAARYFLAAIFLAISGISQAQILYQDQQVQVHDLPSLTARSDDPSDVLVAAVDTIIHDLPPEIDFSAVRVLMDRHRNAVKTEIKAGPAKVVRSC